MSEGQYRVAKVVLMLIFIIGALTIGYRAAENGRYTQFDLRKTYSPDGQKSLLQPPNFVIDTRTGVRVPTQ